MSIADFKTEFSALLKRYAINVVTSPTDESSKGLSSPLEYRDILDAVRDSLRVVLDVKLQYLEESAMRTPANNDIVVATPHAPDVLRMDYNQSDSFENYKLFGESDKKNTLHTHTEEKVEVLDNEMNSAVVDKANNNSKDAKNANSTVNKQKEAAGGFQQRSALTNLLEEAKQDVKKVESCLQRMAAILVPETRPETHAVRRLSTILNPSSAKNNKPNQHQLNQSLRTTILRAKAARRSFVAAATSADDVVTTPTSSRPSLSMPPPSRKSNSTTQQQPLSKLAQHSVSVSNFEKPKSPVKPTKNPKYAHVQSTIPKHVVAKKKTC